MLDQALDAAREVGDGVQFGFVSETRSWVSHRAGRVLECEADAHAGLAVAVEGALDLAYAVGTLAVALIERGLPQDAEALYEEHGFAEITEWETSLAATLFGVRSRVHRALGRPHEALADIERCRDTLAQVGFTSPVFIEWPHDLVLTHLALGDVDAAREVAAEEVAITRDSEHHVSWGSHSARTVWSRVDSAVSICSPSRSTCWPAPKACSITPSPSSSVARHFGALASASRPAIS